MATQPVILTQPHHVVMAQPQGGHWQTSLIDCCSDMEVCFCGICCPVCLACQIAADMQECCLCGPSMAMRSVYRTKYSIPGSLCSDFFITSIFAPCSLCQIKRDIKKRRELGIF